MSTPTFPIQIGRWSLETGAFDYNRMRLVTPGQVIWLTEVQGRLLGYLMQHPDRAIPYEEIIRQVWHFACYSARDDVPVLQTTLRDLRRRIDPHEPRRIITTVHKHLLFHSGACQ